MNTKRILWIDYAKAIAIFLVVLGHSFTPTGGGNLEVKNFIYSFHMPVFFFLSGYLWRMKDDSFKDYLLKSLKSLLIPYFLLNVLAAVVMIPILLASHNYDEIFNRAIDTVIGAAHCYAGPAWFLACLFWIRILIFFTEKIQQPVLMLALSVVGAYAIGKFVWWDVSSALAAFPLFYGGYFVKKKRWIERCRTKYWVLVFMISLPLLLYINHINGSVSIYSLLFGNYPWLYYIETVIGVIFFIALMNVISFRECDLINTLSRESIMIMALHGAVSIYVSVIIGKLLPMDESTLIYGLVKSLVIVVLLYYPCIKIQNKWPILSGGR